jgi:RNA polymerase sigma-70 factor (ECF subfamily)
MCESCEARVRALSTLRPSLARGLRRRGADHATADALSCEVLVVAWQRLDKVPREPADAERWLHAVGHNLWRNHCKTVGRRARRDDVRDVSLVDAYAAEAVTPDIGGRLLVAEAWRRLPRADRALLGEVALDGVDVERLAAMLGCRPRAAVTRLWRARERLRRLMDG